MPLGRGSSAPKNAIQVAAVNILHEGYAAVVGVGGGGRPALSLGVGTLRS